MPMRNQVGIAVCGDLHDEVSIIYSFTQARDGDHMSRSEMGLRDGKGSGFTGGVLDQLKRLNAAALNLNLEVGVGSHAMGLTRWRRCRRGMFGIADLMATWRLPVPSSSRN